jgi:hypothetical protein
MENAKLLYTHHSRDRRYRLAHSSESMPVKSYGSLKFPSANLNQDLSSSNSSNNNSKDDILLRPTISVDQFGGLIIDYPNI